MESGVLSCGAARLVNFQVEGGVTDRWWGRHSFSNRVAKQHEALQPTRLDYQQEARCQR